MSTRVVPISKTQRQALRAAQQRVHESESLLATIYSVLVAGADITACRNPRLTRAGLVVEVDDGQD